MQKHHRKLRKGCHPTKQGDKEFKPVNHCVTKHYRVPGNFVSLQAEVPEHQFPSNCEV